MDIPGVNPAPGGLPPKVTPVPPPAANPAPLSATVRLKPITPPGVKTVAPPPSASAAPVPPTPAAPSPSPSATIRLKPVVPGVNVAKRATSRVQLPPAAPVSVAPVPNTSVTPVSSDQAQTLGAKSKTAPLAAAKTKTSRISLDGVIASAPAPLATPETSSANVPEQKTIRLKRPTVKAVASAPAPNPTDKPAPAATPSDAEVTQKKTIKVKRPGLTLKHPGKPAHPAPAVAKPAAGDDIPDIKDLPSADIPELPTESPAATAVVYGVKPVNKVLSGLAVLAACVALIIKLAGICCSGGQYFSEREATPNTVHIAEGAPLPWSELGLVPDDRK